MVSAMQRFILALVLFLCACAAVDPSSVYRKTLSSTVKIEDDSGLGSGVIINPHCVLTAKHVATKDRQQTIQTQDGKVYYVVAYFLSEYSDVAVVCVAETFTAEPVHIRTNMPPQYAAVFVLGNPLGIDNVLTTGHYQGTDGFTAPIAWGNSGGGVFDEAGSLIGIVSALHVKRIENYVFIFPNLGIMVTVRDIVPFLNENNIQFHN